MNHQDFSLQDQLKNIKEVAKQVMDLAEIINKARLENQG